MEKYKAKFKEITYNADGTANAVFALKKNECLSLSKYLERLQTRAKNGDFDLELSIKRYKEQRSMLANAYLWVLLDKLSETLSTNGKVITKEDLYRKYIQDVGIFKDVSITNNAKDTLRYSWSLLGIGYISEIVEYDDKTTTIRLYYGSSCYNTAQMKRVIDYVVEDCKEVGIETKTPAEIAAMVSLIDEVNK